MNKTAIVIGATGLIGNELINLLSQKEHYQKVKILTRRKLNTKPPHFEQIILKDFDLLSQQQSNLSADHIFCCLGTTMKKAGNKKNFYKVDFEYPLEIAKIARQNGAQKFFLVSAMGADKESLFFYNRVKGELENAMMDLGFQQLLIFRPSILLGSRNEQRTGENIAKTLMQAIAPLLMGPLRQYRPIRGSTVAQAMLSCAKNQHDGVTIYNSDEIKKLVK